MPHLYCFVLLTAGLYTVYTYPFIGPEYFPQEEFPEAIDLQEQFYGQDPYSYLTPDNPYMRLLPKRGGMIETEKRGDINRLIRRLIALYGTNDIEYSGRSTGLRFGPGGR